MNEPNIERIRKYLQDNEVQERIQKSMLDARSKATVTISRAAGLFNFTESQLREWEKRGLLKTDRPPITSDGKTSTGHRQYSPDELDKLALIKELMGQGYSLSEIPPNIEGIWKQILAEQQDQALIMSSYEIRHVHEPKHFLIDKRVDHADQDNFWRYFVSQVLRLSLLLICEDIPDTIAGLIIPLQQDVDTTAMKDPRDLFKVGLSLVGWLGPNKTFYAFLDAAPSFEYPSDFRIEQLPISGTDNPQYSPLIIVQRKAKPLYLSLALVETIQRFLLLVAAHIGDWQPCFDNGMHDWIYQVTDFTNRPSVSDAVLNGLMDIVVELGGKTPDGKNRWRYCNLFLPQDITLPLQQHELAVQANSRLAPIQVGSITLSARRPGLTFRAYQSGHVIYRSEILPHDSILAYREMEESTRSGIAIPIGGSDGIAIAVLYIASEEVDAFSILDQRALRVITRMIEELLMTYQARQQIAGKLSDLLTNPELVDASFRPFLSESDFINNLEALLVGIHGRDIPGEKADEALSLIVVDIDDQSSLAMKLGDRVARNLSRAVGLRIQSQLGIFSDPELRRLYHVNADRYHLLLNGIKLEEAQKRAETLHKVLGGEYRFDARRVVMGRPMLPEGLLELPDVTVRIGVQSYSYKKLKEVLQRYSAETAIAMVRALIMQGTNEALEMGQREGGNCIITWDSGIWGYRRWSPSEAS
jgi:GGDEF domain-containing protein